MIIACGGDGTINEVANGILESGIDVEMGILPSGTGGDFRRSLGISNTERDAARELPERRNETHRRRPRDFSEFRRRSGKPIFPERFVVRASARSSSA
ncbi:MAG: acylglycerol kinase family protein [Acidobacteria bacterium]|nr:acylglycerol kinase family protein [Acidobacteriota bacterium]